MNTNSDIQNPEQNDKFGGGGHIFLYMGIAVVAIVLLKYLVDWLMK